MVCDSDGHDMRSLLLHSWILEHDVRDRILGQEVEASRFMGSQLQAIENTIQGYRRWEWRLGR